MPAGVHNFICEQGATFRRVVTIYDASGDLRDLTNYTARMHVRPYVESSTIMLDLTTENGGITLGGALGTVTVTATATQTAELENDGVYDLEIEAADGTVDRILKGKFEVDLSVTRDEDQV